MGCAATLNGGPAARIGIALFVGDVASSNSATATGRVYAKKPVGADELGEAAMGCAATLNGGPAARIGIALFVGDVASSNSATATGEACTPKNL
ncbi:hypothetical protein TU84_16445 [Pseudomonas helleri]|nr:hypothetical protein TU84_16445 [Pseudomonas helleri]